MDWGPVIDGVELTRSPADLAAEGKLHDVPVLLGTNRDEGTMFVRLASARMHAGLRRPARWQPD